jgi:hypothetical protein
VRFLSTRAEDEQYSGSAEGVGEAVDDDIPF